MTDATPTLPARPPRSRTRRALRGVLWTFAALLALVLLLAAAAWWWAGSSQSLATALAQAARHLPAGQTLESREVQGSLRAGGRIGWLRWQSPTLAVEVHQAEIDWQLRPLLRRRVQLGEMHIQRLQIDKLGPGEDTPAEPLEQIALPVEVELPFRIDDLRWSGPPALQATQLRGRYAYEAQHHALDIEGVDIADGRYGARVRLQGPAPMALDAALQGRVQAPLEEGRSLDVLADATVAGTLSGRDARLRVQAQVRPAEEDADTPMRAQLQANIAPWQPQPVIDARAALENLDLARLWPQAPATQLTGTVEAGPDAAAGPNAWQARADIRNARPGPWDEGGLPVEAVEAQVGFDGTRWRLPEAHIRAGHGRIEAAGEWQPAPEPWKIEATVRGVRPGELHTQLAGAPISGRAEAEQRGEALVFDLRLQAEAGGAGAAGLQGLKLERALAQGQWANEVLELRQLRVEAERALVEGRLQLRVAEQAGSGQLRLALPGGQAQVDGRIAPAQGAGDVQVRVDDAAALQAWVERLPGLETAFAGTSARGSARLDARWQGGWQALQRRLQRPGTPAPRGTPEPTLKATLGVPRLDLTLPAEGEAPPTAVQLREVRAELDGSLAQATLAAQGEAVLGTQRVTLDTRASGGLAGANLWNASLASLRLQAQDSTQPGDPWTLELGRALTGTVRTDGARLALDSSAGAATLRGPVPGTVRIDWEPIRFQQTTAAIGKAFRLQSKGRLQDLPMAWTRAFGGDATLREMGVSGDLMFDGEWDIDAGDQLRARARLARASGDIRVQAGESALVRRIHSTGTGAKSEITTDAADSGPSTPAGLRQAELRVDAEGDSVRAHLAWDSERAGQIRAEAGTRLQQRAGGWQWAPDAPLEGRVSARLPQLGVWSMLAPPGWRVAGTLEADATLSGNRTLPQWNGTLAADQLALRAQVEGLDLRDGRLRATLAGTRVQITDFTLHGGPGSRVRIGGQSGNRSTTASEAAADGGTLTARGELGWGAAPADGAGTGIRMAMQAQVRHLRALVRSDRQITLSGDLQARLDDGRLSVRGDLKTDRAVIILPDETAASLGSDVTVRSAAREREAQEAAEREAVRDQARVNQPATLKPPDIEVGFDLGDDFAVQGHGITTRLEGKLAIRSTSLTGPPRITGEVKTAKGQYRAYGQMLDVESGIARFSGPVDNPALDILAVRPNIAQRAGVRITGSAQLPRVQLYSEPPLSDAETLSWVVLGRASASSGGEALLMQQAALALLSGLGQGGSGGSLASRFGLDEIGFRGPGDGGDLRNSALTLGKRISQDFYLTYERSLAGTLGTLFIFYDLTQRLTLRGQAGVRSGLDLIYTVQYD